MPFGAFTGGVIGTPPAAPGAVPIPADDAPAVVPDVVSSVAGAITSRWVSRGDLASLVPGGLWTGEAPSTVETMPYAVLTQVADVEQARTTGGKLHVGTYQLSVMAEGLTEAETLCRSVADAYDEATLDLDGFMSCFAGDQRWTLGVGLGLGGEDCWTCYVELEISYKR